jgi:hypothetical protein
VAEIQKGHAKFGVSWQIYGPQWKRGSNTSHKTHKNPPTIPPVPFQTSVNPIRNHLRAAFKQHNSIKWTNGSLQGKLVMQVATICRGKCPLKTIEPMSPIMGSNIRHITMGQPPMDTVWQFRKDAFNSDSNAQVKRYKLEELEQEKHASDSHIWNSNHYCIYSSRNISMKDSQKCWTSLAKLFFDDAESRLPSSTDNALLPRYCTCHHELESARWVYHNSAHFGVGHCNCLLGNSS